MAQMEKYIKQWKVSLYIIWIYISLFYIKCCVCILVYDPGVDLGALCVVIVSACLITKAAIPVLIWEYVRVSTQRASHRFTQLYHIPVYPGNGIFLTIFYWLRLEMFLVFCHYRQCCGEIILAILYMCTCKCREVQELGLWGRRGGCLPFL